MSLLFTCSLTEQVLRFTRQVPGNCSGHLLRILWMKPKKNNDGIKSENSMGNNGTLFHRKVFQETAENFSDNILAGEIPHRGQYRLEDRRVPWQHNFWKCPLISQCTEFFFFFFFFRWPETFRDCDDVSIFICRFNVI